MLNIISSFVFAIIPVISLGLEISLDEYVVACLSPPSYPLKRCGFFLSGLDDKSSEVNSLVS